MLVRGGGCNVGDFGRIIGEVDPGGGIIESDMDTVELYSVSRMRVPGLGSC